MRLAYDQSTDSLYIHLSDKASVDSDEVQDGIVLDFAEDGSLVGIDVQHASENANLSQIVTVQPKNRS